MELLLVLLFLVVFGLCMWGIWYLIVLKQWPEKEEEEARYRVLDLPKVGYIPQIKRPRGWTGLSRLSLKEWYEPERQMTYCVRKYPEEAGDAILEHRRLAGLHKKILRGV